VLVVRVQPRQERERAERRDEHLGDRVGVVGLRLPDTDVRGQTAS
jgi:hypothetical protein